MGCSKTATQFNYWRKSILYLIVEMEGAEEERKQFVVPKKEELIEDIKNLDDEIEHVSLNLIKCDFNATEKDVERTFPDFKFVKVKKYNPGSFEVVFETKIDSIHFIKKEFDKKILSRRFFIKMGRQHKNHHEDWLAVGHVPREFRQGPRNQNRDNREKKPKAEEGETHPEEQQQQPKPVVKEQKVQKQHKQHKQQKEVKPQHKEEHKGEAKGHKQEHHKVEHKEEPKKVEEKVHKVPEEAKPAEKKEHKVIPKIEHKPRHNEPKPKKEGTHEQKDPQSNPAEKKATNKATHKVEAAKPVEKVEAPKPAEEKKQEDDGWIVVPAKKGGKKK